MTGPDELLADCNANGIRLTLTSDGGLAIDAPQDALTPELVARLKAHKAELLAFLGNQRLDGRDMQHGTEGGTVGNIAICAGGKSDVQAPFDQQGNFGVADFVALSARQHHAERLEGAAMQPFIQGVDHVSNLSRGKPSTNPAAEETPFGPDGWPVDCIDANDIDPCPVCGTLELWQTLLGNWRCLHCDPPAATWQHAEAVARIRRRVEARP